MQILNSSLMQETSSEKMLGAAREMVRTGDVSARFAWLALGMIMLSAVSMSGTLPS